MTNEPTEEPRVDLRDYTAVLFRRWYVIVAVVAVVVGLSAYRTSGKPDLYRARAEVLLQSQIREQSADDFSPIDYATNVVQTEIQIMTSSDVSTEVVERLGRAPSVSITPVGNTAVVAVTAISEDPAVAADDANTYAATYVDVRRSQRVENIAVLGREIQVTIDSISADLEPILDEIADLEANLTVQLLDPAARADVQNRIDQLETEAEPLEGLLGQYQQQLSSLQLSGNLAEIGGAEVISAAGVPSTPFSPNLQRSLMSAAALGVMLALVAAFVVDHLDDRIRSVAEAQAVGRRPVLTRIPESRRFLGQARPAALRHPGSVASEAFRVLRTSLLFASVDRPLRIIQVTSASARDGKSTTSANLAVTLARAGKRVALVDLDLRRPSQHELFDIPVEPGFTTALLREVKLSEVVVQVEDNLPLAVVPAGALPATPSELLGSDRTEDLVAALAERYDYVVVDSPPVVPVTDPLVTARFADAVLVVVSIGSTRRRELEDAMERLDQVGAEVLGLVVNRLADSNRYGYDYDSVAASRAAARSTGKRRRRRDRTPEVAVDRSGGRDDRGAVPDDLERRRRGLRRAQ